MPTENETVEVEIPGAPPGEELFLLIRWVLNLAEGPQELESIELITSPDPVIRQYSLKNFFGALDSGETGSIEFIADGVFATFDVEGLDEPVEPPPQPPEPQPRTLPIVPTGNEFIDGLLDGSKWNPAAGPVTFSFPNTFGDYADYSTAESSTYLGPNGTDFLQFPLLQRIVMGQFAVAVNQFTSLQLAQAPGDLDASADIRIGLSLPPSGPGINSASTFLPGIGIGGDMWFGPLVGLPLELGGFAYAFHAHELGHALGLKEALFIGGGVANVPVDRGSSEFSVMAKASFVGGPSEFLWANSGPWDYPQSYMMLDIAALQYLYGANYAHNADDTVYTWKPATGEMSINSATQGQPGGPAAGPDANRVFLTIWDGGGIDTYDMSNYTNGVSIDLSPGSWSVTSPEQLAILDVGSGFRARGNVFNALQFPGDNADDSLIERAIGGLGNDVIKGNHAANDLHGNFGDDTISGGLGGDSLWGEGGWDTFRGTLAELDGDRIADYEFGERIIVVGEVFGAVAEAVGANQTAVKIYADGTARTPAATVTLDVPLDQLQDFSNLPMAPRLVVSDTAEGAVLTFENVTIPGPPPLPTARATVTVNSVDVREAGEDGTDGNAEWSLVFSANGQTVSVFEDRSVVDGDRLEIGQTATFTIPNFAAGQQLTLQASGFEEDTFAGTVQRQDLPQALLHVSLPSLDNGLDLEFDLTTPTENANFSYAVSWSLHLDLA
ncbi:MAG TPA: M10 family metallopeptidase C-terminal domain-containing protein [Prosthecobacter sp.]|nr:M10 family metallopeptidase C-terminal domain-containing protein [Prosthecobacter sp.]